MSDNRKVKLSELGNLFKYSYGNEYNVDVSFIYDRIFEADDMLLHFGESLEPIGVIVNEDEVHDQNSELFQNLVNRVENNQENLYENGEINVINYKTLPVEVNISKADIVKGNHCYNCGTRFTDTQFERYEGCPMCGNKGIPDKDCPISCETMLKKDVFIE